MKENQKYLSLEETERLCRLYMECRLTLLEETGLQYILGKLNYSSPVIDEARTLMDLSLCHHVIKDDIFQSSNRKEHKRKRMIRYIAAAASIAVVVAGGVTLWSRTDRQEDFYCQVYENGKQVCRTTAINIAESEMQRIDLFIEKMIDIDNDIQTKLDSFNQ